MSDKIEIDTAFVEQMRATFRDMETQGISVAKMCDMLVLHIQAGDAEALAVVRGLVTTIVGMMQATAEAKPLPVDTGYTRTQLIQAITAAHEHMHAAKLAARGVGEDATLETWGTAVTPHLDLVHNVLCAANLANKVSVDDPIETSYTRAQLAAAVDKAHRALHVFEERDGDVDGTREAIDRAHEALHSVGAGMERVGCATQDPEAQAILADMLKLRDREIPCGHTIADLIDGYHDARGIRMVTRCGACVTERAETNRVRREALELLADVAKALNVLGLAHDKIAGRLLEADPMTLSDAGHLLSMMDPKLLAKLPAPLLLRVIEAAASRCGGFVVGVIDPTAQPVQEKPA